MPRNRWKPTLSGEWMSTAAVMSTNGAASGAPGQSAPAAVRALAAPPLPAVAASARHSSSADAAAAQIMVCALSVSVCASNSAAAQRA